tara:strand:- start:404 stop:655 length:252 start_codon:yes stop_codon:yes gene_type:complete
MRTLADEMIRQGSYNRLRNSYKKKAKELAKNQVDLVLESPSKSKMATFQRKLGDFFESIPSQFLNAIIQYYNQSFQKELQKSN